jgi:phage baseplate assembly protein V
VSSEQFGASETDRRLSAMMIPGTISEVQLKPLRVRVSDGDGWTSALLRVFALSAGKVRTWRPPSIGEDAIILSPSGLPEQGLVIVGAFGNEFEQNDELDTITATDYPDGSRDSHEHEKKERTISIPAGGKLTLNVGASSLVIEDEQITLKTTNFIVDNVLSTFKGMATVEKLLTYLNGMTGTPGDSENTAVQTGIIRIEGDLILNGISHAGHTHQERGDGNLVGPPTNG